MQPRKNLIPKKELILVSLVAAMALAAGMWFALSPSPPAAEPGDRLVAFTLPDLKNEPHAINEWLGKLMVLNFWATWCPPCREEIPVFIELQEQYAERGLQIIGVAIDHKQDVADYADGMFINYPVLLGDEKTLAIMARYGNRIGTLPYSVVIAPDGRIVGRKMGAYTRTELETQLKPWWPAKSAKSGPS